MGPASTTASSSGSLIKRWYRVQLLVRLELPWTTLASDRQCAQEQARKEFLEAQGWALRYLDDPVTNATAVAVDVEEDEP